MKIRNELHKRQMLPGLAVHLTLQFIHDEVYFFSSFLVGADSHLWMKKWISTAQSQSASPQDKESREKLVATLSAQLQPFLVNTEVIQLIFFSD